MTTKRLRHEPSSDGALMAQTNLRRHENAPKLKAWRKRTRHLLLPQRRIHGAWRGAGGGLSSYKLYGLMRRELCAVRHIADAHTRLRLLCY